MCFVKMSSGQTKISEVNAITAEDVKIILSHSGFSNKKFEFIVHNASDKMLGFLADYWKLKVAITENSKRKELFYFIKALSRTNASKAEMAKELNLYQKEVMFYSIVKNKIYVAGIKPWSAKFVTLLNDALVFEDLNELQYKLRSKYDRFDMAHTLQALRTLANFHACSIIFEENKKKELQRPYTIAEQFPQLKNPNGCLNDTASWFIQCKKGALEAIKTFSDYSKDNHTINMIESRWDDVWSSALALSNTSKYLNVICHGDLWNNNFLFQYKNIGDTLEPDDCVFVDFQTSSIQPLVSDVMLLLYCNLEPTYREENMAMFLNFYHQELRMILCGFGVSIDNVLVKEDFFASAEVYRQWGLILCACMIPQFWVDDDLTTKIFGDSASFDDIMNKTKATFIKRMMQANPDYKKNVMAIFEEIVVRYCD